MKASHMSTYDWDRERESAMYKHEQYRKKTKKEITTEKQWAQYGKEKYASWQKGRPLTDDEWEVLFWKELVPYGWLIDDKYIVLPCEKCNSLLNRVLIQQVRDQLYDIGYYQKTRIVLKCKKCKDVPMSK